jgi:Bifunctional DNA primase/polymerase, N-terminal
MSGVFADWQPLYAEHGIATFPVKDKIPCVRNWQRLGLNGSSQLAMKFPDADAFGFQCGARNRITLIDIDSDDENVVAEAIKLFGKSPILWRTGGGHFAMPFRHNGESRRIRALADLPIDLLGSGYAVAPPSKGSKQRYEFLQGTLADFDRLPVIRLNCNFEQRTDAKPIAIEGERNDKLFRHCLEQAQYCDTFDDLLDVARAFNDDCLPPDSNMTVVKTATSAWKRTLGGTVRHGMVSVPRPAITALAPENPDALALFTVLAAFNGRDSTFWIANGMAGTHVGLSIQRLVRARNELLKRGIIQQVSTARQHSPALYRWGNSLGCGFISDPP